MKFKSLYTPVLLFLCVSHISWAQEPDPLPLIEAVIQALENSDASKISEDKVRTAENELKVTQNLRYPDVSVSGQYQYLGNADANLKLDVGNNGGQKDGAPTENPKIHQLLLGQANVSLPIFSGFKLKNAVAASDNAYNAATFTAKNDRAQIALQTITDYIALYKADHALALIRENLKSAQQRVKDFTAMEENGLLARNDLLKAKIQESNIQVSLKEAQKNKDILNYRLAVTLKLPENSEIATVEGDWAAAPTLITDSVNRNDLEALRFQEKAAQNQIKMAKAKYYPSLSLMGGYIALDVQNALTITNAMNLGVGVSYNLADIFKAKSDVKVAESRAMELQHTLDRASDQVKVQIENARQEYHLALDKYDVYLGSEEQAQENYRIVKDKYDNGLVDTNDLLEADVDRLQAQINTAYAKADIGQKYYELLTAKGHLIEAITAN